MKVKIYCPCGTTLIWSFEAENPSVTTGIGDTQDCCRAKIAEVKPLPARQPTGNITPLKGGKSR